MAVTNDTSGKVEIGTLSLAETARQLGIGVTTAYQLVARDEFPIPVRHIGRRMKVLKHDLDLYLRGELPPKSVAS